ncbi:MAG: FtsH protease activity modulator HflK [Bryobacteraceae bacterium]|nr:FtsH protease activity modulator HflK [Bryobacteraceae bacterium]
MHQHKLEISPHAHDEGKERLRYFGFAGVVGLLLLLNVAGVFTNVFGIDTAAILAVVAGYRTFYNAISLLLEKVISADLAICIAVIAALAAGEYLAAAEAMFIMLVGEGLEGYASKRTSSAIQRFVEQMPLRARLVREGEEVEVSAGALVEGDVILVRAGERIPADGAIVQGASAINESTITGESLPRDKEAGDEVFSGTLNGHGLLRIRVSRAGSDTTLARVVKLVEESRNRKAPVERLADRYARYFLPALLIAAGATFYFTRDWLRTVAVLIIGCPCALILATPAAMVAAIGGLARRGILVRGGSALQKAAKVDAIVFDKTGTVTEGRFEIIAIVAARADEADVLRLAAAAERGSDHVLARVIAEEAQRRGLAVPAGEDARILAGRGAECSVDGRMLRAGSAAFLEEHGIGGAKPLLAEADRLGATAVLVAEDTRLAGAILLRDRVRDGAREAVHQLEHLEITRQVMLTGDRRRAAEAIAREIGIPAVEAELLPEQKVERVRQLISEGRVVAMAGDGVNDAPALAAAHVGIAVSGASDITAEAADVVYMGHSLDKLPKLFEVSRRAVGIAWQNIIVFAGIVNALAVGFASAGAIGPLGAAVFHQAASFLVMVNSLRLLRVERRRSAFRHWLHHRLEHTPLPEAWQRVKAFAAGADPKDAFNYVVEHRRRLAKPLAIGAGALYVLSGAYVLGPDEAGVVERFGRRLLPIREPGLHYKLPWPVERLTRIQASRVRTIEIGFRSGQTHGEAEPAAYEWNVQHRSGRFQRMPEESLMVSGDMNMLEVTATVHYRLARPDDYLLRLLDGETTLRAAAESALQAVVTTTPLDDVLTARRRAIEQRTGQELQTRLDKYRAGIEVLGVRLLDVHPSLEVVDAFRDVSGAFEEKNRLVNEAEGYRNEQVALARGNADANRVSARGYSLGRKNRAEGDSGRFIRTEEAFRQGPGLNETRMYLETMEEALAGRPKMIVDSKGRRRLALMDDGLGFLPLAMEPPAPRGREQQ